ncbi:MAG TPA: GYD domain-containing protein [Candidatus Sulfopaludibacter sp.]|nr:GYD domain-containing protein [Candidatus Sulfopaludibacter sp.]
MPKYLIQARYTNQGIQGLVTDSASGRRADVQAAVKALGGQVEVLYFAFGEDDAIVILDLPGNTAAAALSLTISGAGAVRVRTTPLLTVEDVDQALEIHTQYRAPGA